MNRLSALCAALTLATGAAAAGPVEVARSATESASAFALKAEKSVKKGLHAAAGGIEKGVKVANRTADKVAVKLGIPVDRPAPQRAADPSR